MNASEKNSFEEQWRDAFENAGLDPDPAVWANIETHLADAEAAKYKRKLYVFKMRVAAAVAFLVLATGSWALWQYSNQDLPVIARHSAGNQSSASSASRSVNGRASANPPVANATGGQIDSSSNKNLPKNFRNKIITTQDKTGTSDIPESTIAARNNPVGQKGKVRLEQDPLAVSTPAPADVTVAQRTKDSSLQRTVSKGSAPAMLSDNEWLARSAKAARNDKLKNSIPVGIKSPASAVGKETVGEEKPDTYIAENTVSTQPEAVDSRQVIASLNALPIHIPAVKLEAKDIRFQLNKTFWDQLAAADIADQEKKTRKHSRWQLGAGITPGYFNPNFSSNATPVPVSNQLDQLSNMGVARADLPNSGTKSGTDLADLTRPGISYTTGVDAEFSISRRLALQGGIQYTYSNSKIEVSEYYTNALSNKRQPIFYDVVTNNTSIQNQNSADAPAPAQATNAYAAPVTSAEIQNLDNTYQYMGFPMRLVYRVIDKKIRASVGAGVSADLFLRNRINSQVDNVESIDITRAEGSVYRNLGMSGLLSVKLDYHIGGKYSIYVEPSYRRALVSFTSSSNLESYPSWWGIGTGLLYRF